MVARALGPLGVLAGWLLALLAIAAPSVAAVEDPRFTADLVASGLAGPTDVAVAPDGSFFVAEKRGTVVRFATPEDPSPTLVVDLRLETNSYHDRGLLSIALDPEFPIEPWLYLAYTYDAPPGEVAPFWGAVGVDADPCPSPPGPTGSGCVVRGRLSRISVLGGLEQVLVDERWCNQFPSHSMAGMTFGPDGALYVGAGDGGAYHTADWGQLGQGYWEGPACGDPENEGGALRAQDARTGADPASWDGSIVRLDPATGAALPDNPLVGIGTADDDAIIAFGLRNPFRIAFDPADDSLWIGDVGWRQVEELDRVASPTDEVVENFGWPCREGLDPVPEYAAVPLCQSFPAGDVGVATDPRWALDRDVADPDGCGFVNGPRAFAGLAFATSSQYPLAARSLFVADLASGCIWSLPRSIDGLPDPQARVVVAREPWVVSLRAGVEGEIWWVDIQGGSVHRLVSRLVFEDGFDSGSTGAWSSSVP